MLHQYVQSSEKKHDQVCVRVATLGTLTWIKNCVGREVWCVCSMNE